MKHSILHYYTKTTFNVLNDLRYLKIKHLSTAIMKKLLGIKIVHDLSFYGPVTSLCKKTSLKLNALSKTAFSMTFNKRRVITVK